jgi:hypothetical protein
MISASLVGCLSEDDEEESVQPVLYGEVFWNGDGEGIIYQNDTETCDGIANEWEPCSKELLESMDVLIYALITDTQYHLPQNAPDGDYNPPNEA